MDATLEERLTELETRLAFADDTMTSLSDSVAAHDRQIFELRNAVERLLAELVAMRGVLAPAAGDEPPPPHY